MLFGKFWMPSEVSLFRQKVFFDSFRLKFSNWKVNLVYLGVCSYRIKVSLPGIQAWIQRNEGF